MADASSDQYSAGEQGLGYIYQPRFALLKLLQLPESTSVLIEKDDDLDFLDKDGVKTLASLKHKAVGDRLTDLSTDFWKSVRIWLARYNRDGRSEANLRFIYMIKPFRAPTTPLPSWKKTRPHREQPGRVAPHQQQGARASGLAANGIVSI